MITGQSSSHYYRLDKFPTEMISIILDFCDPRTIINIICTCKRLGVLSLQTLLNGRNRREYQTNGVSVRSLFREDWAMNITPIPNEILNCYLEFLMKEDELEEMKRLDLCLFSSLEDKHMKNVVNFINKFQIEELIMEHNDGNIRWINRNSNNFKYICKLSTVVLRSGWSQTDCKLVPFNLKVMETVFLSDNADIDNFCNLSYCSNFEELKIITPESIFGYAFVKILEKCTNLKSFELRVSRFYYKINSIFLPIEITPDTLKILRNCKKLEELRFDGHNDKYMNIAKTVDNMEGIFPNLKKFECFIPTYESCLVPKHELELLSLYKLDSNDRLPKCDTFYLIQSSRIPEIDCRKLFLIEAFMTGLNKNLCEMLSIIPELKELHIFQPNISYTENALKNSHQLGIEKLWIRKGYFDGNMLIHLMRNCPNLKELHVESIKITNDTLIIDTDTRKESKLRVLHFKSCSQCYPLVIRQLAQEFTFTHLESIILENAYSVTKDILSSLLLNVKTKPSVNISGVEFDNELIGKYLELRDDGFEFSFNGKNITFEYLKTLDVIKGVATFSLPDCVIENDEMIHILDMMQRDKLTKIQINLGNSGPTIELFKKLQEFPSLQLIYLVGKPETKIEGFEQFILDDFLISMPNIRLLYLESGEFNREAIENTKGTIRILGRSAPKLLIPMERGPYPFKIKEKQESWCRIM